MNSTDSSNFSAAVRALEPELRAYVYRLIGNRADSEDLLQEALAKAVERQSTLKDADSTRPWLYRIATTTCLDFLRKQKRWSQLIQVEVEDQCHQNDGMLSQIVGSTREPEFSFDVHEHLSFCFTCVGRSLPPEEHAAIVLREFFGLTNQEAADALDITEPTLRRHLSQGRRQMEQAFDHLCSLVNKKGICRQCENFRGVLPEERKGPALPVLQEAADPWQARLKAAAERGVQDGRSQGLHEVFFRLIEQVVGEGSIH